MGSTIKKKHTLAKPSITSLVCEFFLTFSSFFLSCVSASRDGTTCSFADPAFVVYSSVASFYVPFIVTLLVYAQICVVLRKRGRRTAPPRGHGEPGEGHRHRKVEGRAFGGGLPFLLQ